MFHRTGGFLALLLFPCLMTFHEHSFDGASVTTGTQLPVLHTPTDVDRRIVVSMGLEATHLTAERPLIRSIRAARVVAHAALLGRIRTDDRGCLDPPFLTIPDNLLWDAP